MKGFKVLFTLVRSALVFGFRLHHHTSCRVTMKSNKWSSLRAFKGCVNVVIVYLYIVLCGQYMSRPSRHPHGSYQHVRCLTTALPLVYIHHLDTSHSLPVVFAHPVVFSSPLSRRLVYNYEMILSVVNQSSVPVCIYVTRSAHE
jgi:hypothetical protein